MTNLVVFEGFGHVLLDVSQALLPLVVFFFIFQIFFMKLPAEFVKNLLKGLLLVLVGTTLFLQGVRIGFLPAGQEIGAFFGDSPYRLLLIPVGFLLGFTAALAEPAVRVLSIEVEKASSGYIKKNLLIYTLSLGVAIFVALDMARIIYGLPFHYLVVPGYLLALVLLKFSNPAFTAIAFDAGGVATGPMTVTFILSMAVGAATVMEGRSAVVDGFGLIALVALAPILSIMLLGMIYKKREGKDDGDKA